MTTINIINIYLFYNIIRITYSVITTYVDYEHDIFLLILTYLVVIINGNSGRDKFL